MLTSAKLMHWTPELVRAIPEDGSRYECIDGELLVTPPPDHRHAVGVGSLWWPLHVWCDDRHLGKVAISPSGVELVMGTLVQPDLFVIPPDASGAFPRMWSDVRQLMLAIEVSEASTAHYDRTVKRRFFLRSGVPQYWIVDMDARLIERWTMNDERPEVICEDGILEWKPPGSDHTFTLPVGKFFASVLRNISALGAIASAALERRNDAAHDVEVTDPAGDGAMLARDLLHPFCRAEQPMAMPAASQPTYWTPELVRELPDDGNRYECIDGELLVTPSPGDPHQFVAIAFYRALFPYVGKMGIGLVQVAPADVTNDSGSVVQPDVFVFRDLQRDGRGEHAARELFLVVEVLSKSTAKRDRTIKRAFYARIGVHEYWIVDQAARQVERWRVGATAAELESGTLTWQPFGATRPLLIDLPALFDAIPEGYRTP